VTPVKVVDASALGALLFGEPEAEAVAGRLGDARLVAPPLLGFELTNVCLMKSRRSLHRLTRARNDAAHLQDPTDEETATAFGLMIAGQRAGTLLIAMGVEGG
jgi:uncharacterized protein with PIN domain